MSFGCFLSDIVLCLFCVMWEVRRLFWCWLRVCIVGVFFFVMRLVMFWDSCSMRWWCFSW